jgi:hypothetical protein
MCQPVSELSRPNDRLRLARGRQPSRTRPGLGMSRDELATAVNAWLHRRGILDADVDANYVGKLERGVYRWPNKARREALRAVLGAADDLTLGMYIVRSTGRVCLDQLGVR